METPSRFYGFDGIYANIFRIESLDLRRRDLKGVVYLKTFLQRILPLAMARVTTPSSFTIA